MAPDGYNRKAELHMERYRSGHNGTDSKSVEGQLSVGSNPTRSARKVSYENKRLFSFIKAFRKERKTKYAKKQQR